MIEVPHEFLNALFMLLIVFAGVNRSRQTAAQLGRDVARGTDRA